MCGLQKNGNILINDTACEYLSFDKIYVEMDIKHAIY